MREEHPGGGNGKSKGRSGEYTSVCKKNSEEACMAAESWGEGQGGWAESVGPGGATVRA